jgi:alpha-D-ribose 1-methylphosphonate 5-triphosphate synthase subunit PhnI
MYVAAKGGERAITNAHALLAKEGRGDLDLPRIDFAAVAGQLGVLVSRVMTEGSLYDPGAGRARHRAGAGRRARGDYAGALVPHYAAALRLHAAADTAGLPPQRRISATFKDLPGGQQPGATFDYTHRLFTGRDASSSARRQKAPPYQAPEPTTPPEGAPSPSTPRGGPETGPGGALVPEMPRDRSARRQRPY